MTYGLSFLTVSVLMLAAASQRGGWYNALIYPALSFAIVAFGYLGAGPRVFGKNSNGRRSWIAAAVLLPYLLFTLATWYLVRLVSREPAVNRVDSDLYLSRRLSNGELPVDVKTVVDLTCEFTDPRFPCDNYFCFPILDASCPTAEKLTELANQILTFPMPILIHCAQGHGRTGLVASAVLLAAGKVSTAAKAIEVVKAIRPGIELNARQRKTLDLVPEGKRAPLNSTRSMADLSSLLRRVQAELPLRCSATKKLLDNLPDWFRELGTDLGIAKLEENLKAKIPESLRLFYRFPATGCWLCAHYDTDIFLEFYEPEERLHIVRWYYRPHLVLAQFPPDLSICAVQLDSDTPRIKWGEDGSHLPSDHAPTFFVDWLSRIAEELIEQWS